MIKCTKCGADIRNHKNTTGLCGECYKIARKRVERFCACGAVLSRKNKIGTCSQCLHKSKNFKFTEVRDYAMETNHWQTGVHKEVSDNGIRKYFKKNGFDLKEAKFQEEIKALVSYFDENSEVPSMKTHKKEALIVRRFRDRILTQEEKDLLDSISLTILHSPSPKEKREQCFKDMVDFIKFHKRMPKRDEKNHFERNLNNWFRGLDDEAMKAKIRSLL